MSTPKGRLCTLPSTLTPDICPTLTPDICPTLTPEHSAVGFITVLNGHKAGGCSMKGLGDSLVGVYLMPSEWSMLSDRNVPTDQPG